MRVLPGAMLAVIVACAFPCASAQETDTTYPGLRLVPDTKVARAYVDPEADFSRYSRVMVEVPHVAFRKHWGADHPGVSAHDMERMKGRLANLFLEEFQDVLEEGGVALATGIDEDVLILRPALVDLDVAAPDPAGTSRSRSFVANSGAVTLYVELLDATTGAMLARAIDRKVGRNRGSFTLASSVYNASEARAAFHAWAVLLRDRFLELRTRQEGENTQ